MRSAAVVLLLSALGLSGAEFRLVRDDGKAASFDLDGHVSVVVFWSPHCARCQEMLPRLDQAAAAFAAQGVQMRIVDSNTNEAAADLARAKKKWGISQPLWLDPGGELAGHLGAAVTPEAFVMDAEGKLRYRGQFDDAIRETAVKKRFVTDAVAALLAGQAPPVTRTIALGCTIKKAAAD